MKTLAYPLLPALTNTARCAWETLSITDSSKEQRKDINSEIKSKLTALSFEYKFKLDYQTNKLCSLYR